jgi:hypothetical protein
MKEEEIMLKKTIEALKIQTAQLKEIEKAFKTFKKAAFKVKAGKLVQVTVNVNGLTFECIPVEAGWSCALKKGKIVQGTVVGSIDEVISYVNVCLP